MAEGTKSIHRSVLLQEVVDALNLREGSVVLDGTINGGGHSEAICRHLGREGVLLGMDLDKDALARAKERLAPCLATVHLVEDNYRNMDKALHALDIKSVDAVLLDLGFSSDQLEHSGRGISFQKDEPLLLTLRSVSSSRVEEGFTAQEIVNNWDEEHISDVIYGYGEERFSRRIAREIVKERQEKKIVTTGDLVRIIESAVPAWYKRGRLHPATRTFQALRIAVNDEIESLREGLTKAFNLLSHEGHIVVISFHSIEDRVVKRAFANTARDGKGIVITKKPIVPRAEEVKDNPRARSAKLRIFEVRK